MTGSIRCQLGVPASWRVEAARLYDKAFGRKFSVAIGSPQKRRAVLGVDSMNENNIRTLGRTGLKVGRLGVACSYGAPTKAFEEAFDHGVNYFYWGSMRKAAMGRAIRNIIASRLSGTDRPGIVTYTATRWGDLLKSSRMPHGQAPMSSADCYRFVLSNPNVDVCMTGPKNLAQMREALKAYELGPLSPEELKRVHRIGDHVHRHHRRLLA